MHGVRVADLYHPAAFRDRLARIIDYKNRLLGAMLPDFQPFDARVVAEEYLAHAERLRPYVRDTTSWLHRAPLMRAAACSLKGLRVRCWTSITAAIRT